MMWIVILIFSFYGFLKLLGYGYFEMKKNNNKVVGIIIMVMAFISVIAPTVVTIIRCYS